MREQAQSEPSKAERRQQNDKGNKANVGEH